MPKPKWNSTTTPEEGAVVYMFASDNIGQYLIPFPTHRVRRGDGGTIVFPQRAAKP